MKRITATFPGEVDFKKILKAFRQAHIPLHDIQSRVVEKAGGQGHEALAITFDLKAERLRLATAILERAGATQTEIIDLD
jgi:hypothetical protein